MHLLLAAIVPAVAQIPLSENDGGTAVPPRVREAIAEGYGVGALDGVLWGVGPGYRVQFAPAGPRIDVFNAKGIVRLSSRLQAVERTGAAGLPLDGVAVRRVGDAVHYEHGAVVERYVVGRRGVEQSFVLYERPAGRGDLVVRLALRSSGELRAADEERGLRFGAGAVEVEYGVMTAIDARGRRHPGRVRYHDGQLELVVAEAFVDGAALPLLIDPLIGPPILQPTTIGDRHLDLAYDETHDLYLCVWARPIGRDVLALRFRPDGRAVGSSIPVEVGWGVAVKPRVANVNGADAFVIGHSFGVRAVSAATGAVSALVFVGQVSDVSGDARPNGRRAIAVYDSGGVFADEFDIAPQGAAVLPVGTLGIGPPGFITNLRVTAQPGAAGRYLAVWEDPFAASVYGTWFDQASRILDGPKLIATNALRPVVAGDGDRWLVAYDITPRGPRDIACKVIDWDVGSGASVIGAEVRLTNSPPPEQLMGAEWAGESVVLSYHRQYSAQRIDGLLGSVDPGRCGDCEGEMPLETPRSTYAIDQLAFATTHSGSLKAGTGGLAIWQRTDTQFGRATTTGIARFVAEDGVVTDLGGGCGLGGRAVVSCARRGNSLFVHRARNAAASVPALLLLGAPGPGLPCGPCVVVPSLTGAIALPALTSAAGAVDILTPIPDASALFGAAFVDQWLTLPPAGQCAPIGFDTSNALRVVIE